MYIDHAPGQQQENIALEPEARRRKKIKFFKSV
jgi:hypothetical protein